MNFPCPRIVEKAAEARANNKERNKMKKEIEREAKLGTKKTVINPHHIPSLKLT